MTTKSPARTSKGILHLGVKALRILTALGVCLALAACGDDGDSSDDFVDPGNNLADACAELSGSWEITNHCQSDLIGSTFTISQNGCSITVEEYQFSGSVDSRGGFTVSGSVQGDSLTCNGSVRGDTLTESCTFAGEGERCVVEAVRR